MNLQLRAFIVFIFAILYENILFSCYHATTMFAIVKYFMLNQSAQIIDCLSKTRREVATALYMHVFLATLDPGYFLSLCCHGHLLSWHNLKNRDDAGFEVGINLASQGLLLPHGATAKTLVPSGHVNS